MKCPKCSHVNEDGAMFCSNCGQPLVEKKKDWPSIILLAYCCSILFFALLYLFLRYVFQWTEADWHTINYVYMGMSIITSLLTLIIPFGIRTLWIKITAFVLVAIAALIKIVQNVLGIIDTINSHF